MWHVMMNLCNVSVKKFDTRLMDINEYLPLFPGSDNMKIIADEEMNEIILHTVPIVWMKQAHLQGFVFDLEY